MKRLAVFGARGLIGQAFVKWCLDTQRGRLSLVRIDCCGGDGVLECDLGDRNAVLKTLKEVQPDYVLQAAGVYARDFDASFRSNVLFSKHVLDALRESENTGCRTILLGSAAEVGHVEPLANPVCESVQCRPVSNYGLTKAMQTMLALSYCAMYKMDIVVARLFNVVGPGASASLFVGRILQEIADSVREKRRIHVGNLDSVRDYLDVTDVASALWVLFNRGQGGEVYNVGMGEPIIMRRLLELLLHPLGLSLESVVENAFVRKGSDIPAIWSNTSKLQSLGWIPRKTVQQSARNMAMKVKDVL